MSKQGTSANKQPPVNKRMKRQERREEERRLALRNQQSRRTRRIVVAVAVLFLLAGLGVFYLMASSHSNTGAQSSQTDTNTAFSPVNGVSCDRSEHYDYHHHIHLSMYMNGQAVAVPSYIGINPAASSPCLYWLHTHDTSGVVHIESPLQRTYTLGNFFDVWSQRFAQLGYPGQLNQAAGWQVYVNGQAYKGDFHSIPMDDHTLVTLAFNSPDVKPETLYNWNGL
ncbi:MAG: hypothetical protein PVS3B1_24220 [Ktedonobacteraceae bacterium]